MMTLSYNFGLTAGSLLAYVIESMLNPIGKDHCGPIDANLPFSSSNTTIGLVTNTTPLTTIMTTIFSTVTDISNNTSKR